MKQNQNTVAEIDHKRTNSWPFLTFSSVAENTGRCREVILAVVDTLLSPVRNSAAVLDMTGCEEVILSVGDMC